MQLSLNDHQPWRQAPAHSARYPAPPPRLRSADGGVPPQAIVLGALQPIGVTARVARGRQIFVEGEAAAHWYWLASGAVQVCSFAEHGKRHVAELVLPGDLFGLEACARRGATAEAARDAVVVAYPRARAEALVDADPRLARAFREVACGRLQHAQACLFRLGKTSALARVASFLLEMGERCRRGADGSVDVPITCDDIADYLGLTSETVSRALTELRRRGAIRLPARQSIHLADRAALASAKDAGR
jgi:CRP/FNR family transcriptional regulator, nitrogen fixation regulation protein